MEDNAVVFIDGSNLYHIVRNSCPSFDQSDFDFEKFLKKITRGLNLKKVCYYNSPLDRGKDKDSYIRQQKFFNKLRAIPNFEVVLCRMQKTRINGKIVYQVKEDDIHLAVDMVKMACDDFYDVGILVSSDGDFVPAIEAVQNSGKRIRNVGFDNRFSYHLKKVCDEFVKLKTMEVEEFFT